MGALEKCRGTKNPPRPKIWPAIPVGSGIKLDRKDRKTERWSRGIGEACYCESTYRFSTKSSQGFKSYRHIRALIRISPHDGTWTFMGLFYHIIDKQCSKFGDEEPPSLTKFGRNRIGGFRDTCTFSFFCWRRGQFRIIVIGMSDLTDAGVGVDFSKLLYTRRNTESAWDGRCAEPALTTALRWMPRALP